MVAYATPALLLGMNLFTGKPIAVTSDEVSSPGDLVENNDPWTSAKKDDWKGAPGLYIVGVEKVLLGGHTASSIQGLPPGGVGVINDKSAKGSNPGSIVALLIWRAASDAESLRISFFTAGDAEFEVEEALTTWLEAETIKVIKAGHHGSAAGTVRSYTLRFDYFS